MAAAIAEALDISLDYLVGNSDLLLEKILSIKFLIFKNLIPKKKGMFSLCSTHFYNPKKLKKCSLRKITKPHGLSGFVVLGLPYTVLLVCPAAMPAPHIQQRLTVGFELFQLYQQRQNGYQWASCYQHGLKLTPYSCASVINGYSIF